MKLKNILYSSAVVAVAALFTACSDIDENDRFEYVKPASVNRAVLIEDFTGQNCVYCPNGTEIIEGLLKQYGEEHIIAVGMHSGPLGFKGSKKYVGLKTDIADTYYNAWGVTTQPTATINRSVVLSDYTKWGAAVAIELQKEAKLSLNLTNTYDEASRQLTINVEAYGTDGNTDGKLTVWLLEDGVQAYQKDQSGYNYDYIHNHVFRANVTADAWGDAISVKEGVKSEKSYTYTLPEGWNADNVSVVAFVNGADNHNVEQVTKKAIKPQSLLTK